MSWSIANHNFDLSLLSFYNKQIYSVVELTSHIIYIHIEISTHN